MNVDEKYACSPLQLIRSFTDNRFLIRQMTWREVSSRYKGAVIGLAWSFLTPLLMLGVYTFVFSTVFKSRWGVEGAAGSKTEYALILFIGMIIHSLFSEIITRAPTLVVANANYVKKVIFPVEILTFISAGAAIFHSIIATSVFVVGQILIQHQIPWTVVFLPVVVLPLIIAALGFSWLLASLGVFLRDLPQLTAILSSILIFLAPIFYPMSAVPTSLQPIILLNPLTFIVQQAHKVALFGEKPDFVGLAVYTAIACVLAWFGFTWFQKTRKAFADVL